MVELVDTRDLKSLGQWWPYGFDSRSGHNKGKQLSSPTICSLHGHDVAIASSWCCNCNIMTMQRMLAAPLTLFLHILSCFLLLVSGKNVHKVFRAVCEPALERWCKKLGLSRSLEETTEHRRGRKPPLMMRWRKKPRKGDRDIKHLVLNTFLPSVALSGLLWCAAL